MGAMKKACALDDAYPRLWLEYNQLAAKMNISNEERLSMMELHPETTSGRDDLHLRFITQLNCTGRYQDALKHLEEAIPLLEAAITYPKTQNSGRTKSRKEEL